MRFSLSLILCCGLAAGVLIACGSDDESGSAPTVSNLQYSPTSAQSFTGQVTVSGSFDFTDPDGDPAFYRVSLKPCGWDDPIHFDFDHVGTTGSHSGTIHFSNLTDTECEPGDYDKTIRMCDQKGNWSNAITLVFTLL